MMGLVMAGGKGTRMGGGEEKLLLLHRKPVVLCVVDALRESGCISKVLAATSENSPKTQSVLEDYGVETIRTHGDGYVTDLMFALSNLEETVLVVSGDLPLLDSQIVRTMISMYDDSAWQSFVVTKKFLREQKMDAEFSVIHDGQDCYYTGISIVDPKRVSPDIRESRMILDDKRIALNLNTEYDYSLLKGT